MKHVERSHPLRVTLCKVVVDCYHMDTVACECVQTYGKKFEFYDGETLVTETPEYDIPDMYLRESRAFIESTRTGEKNRSNIDSILESAKLLDALYQSADLGKEVTI